VFSAELPPGDDVFALLDAVSVEVPPRGPLRFNVHRERFCLVAALRWLARERPDLFPLMVARDRPNQAPDFMLTPVGAGRPVAIEHCDAGLRVYQRWLDRSDNGSPELVPSPNGDGWVGDAPERTFEKQVALAICRKRQPKTWRDAPADSKRLILVYDNTSTGMFVKDASVVPLLGNACSLAGFGQQEGESVLLIRSQERAFAWGSIAKGQA
jgi:hypothetical protein